MRGKHLRRRLITSLQGSGAQPHIYRYWLYAVFLSNTFSFSAPVHKMLHWSDSTSCQMTACGYSAVCWVWYNDNKAGGPKHERCSESVACHQSQVSLHLAASYLCDTLVIRNKSLLKDVQEWPVNSSLKQTHTSLSRRDDNSGRLWGGEKERVTAAER